MNFKELTNYLDNLEKIGIPYCDLSVHIGGEEVYRHFCGISDIEKNKKVDNTDIYWLYSTSKVPVCVAVMRLYSENKLDIDDNVSKYLPYFKYITVNSPEGRRKAKREVTIRDLMAMKSGLDYDLKTAHLEKVLNETDGNTQAVAEAISKRGFLFDPGEHFNYSLSHDILGAIIEVASGKKLGEYLDEIIFTPLDMKTFKFGHKADFDKISDQYYYDPYFEKSVPTVKNNMYVLSENYESGGAGLIGSVDDYLKFADTLCRGGTSKDGYELIKEEYINKLTENQMTTEVLQADFENMKQGGYGYALGIRVMIEEGRPSPKGEFGWDSAAGAWVLIDRENDLTAFYAQHVLDCGIVYSTIHHEIKALIYKGLKEE